MTHFNHCPKCGSLFNIRTWHRPKIQSYVDAPLLSGSDPEHISKAIDSETRVQCEQCGLMGPYRETVDLAYDAWNEMGEIILKNKAEKS